MKTNHLRPSDFENSHRVSVVLAATLACILFALVIASPMSADIGKPSVTVTNKSGSFLPGFPGARLFGNMRKDQQISEEMVVRILYRSLQEATAASGKPVTLGLDGFSTLYPDDFSRVRWSELVTPQDGRHLRIERVEIHDGRGPLGISYVPSWTTVASEQSPELQRLTHSLSIKQLFIELAAQAENLNNVVAATRYRVTVSFEGISRSYNAAVLWLDPDRDGVVTIAVQDNITDRIDEAVTERLRVAPRAFLERQPQAETSAEGTGNLRSITESATTCEPHDASHSFPQSSGPDVTGHKTGYHSASVRFNYDCHCDSTCRSTCLPRVTDKQCYETGTLSGPAGTHKPRTTERIVSGSKPNTDFTGADCGAGWACYIQYCPANVCSGFLVSSSAQPLNVGIGITFNASSQAVWDGQQDFPFQCDGCSVGEGGDVLPPPDYQDPYSGWGGGWGESCYWSCVPQWSGGIYYEECTLGC